ncbi:MAG: NAD(P)/FAD-dependent oxidoreductase [Clostridia bacterium]|nr:NAD(P)/FAD-dependent oxidoreductase [Clostridia bacterium]MBR7172982.1 NAD(P)/FAD-dependent oxidoreductase [Clostridia bacterium]
MENDTDILIVGAGVIGCALARELSRYSASVAVLDRGWDVAEGASKANSGIVHAGYDAEPGTLKARYNVEGARMFPALCEELGVPFSPCGALVLGFSEEDRSTLKKLLDRGIANGVPDLRMISREEALSLEPNLNPEVCCALLVPTSGIVSPYELTFALADDAALNGVTFHFGQTVHSVRPLPEGGFAVSTDQEDWKCRIFVNCAGASSADLHNQLSSLPLRVIHRRGQYYLLDRPAVPPFVRTLFQCPSVMGKGVLVSPTVHGNVLLGPSAEDIDDPLDTATTQSGLDSVLEKVRLTWPGVSLRTNITNFSGVRAHEESGDFVIGAVRGCPGAYETVGIESPGLSSAPAIAKALSEQIASEQALARKAKIVPFRKPAQPFREMTPEARQAAIESDSRYGSIVCRCEVITEAEIVAAVHRPVPARSIDAVKRRTRAGMGRCQGGFCSPRVAAIISRETGLPLLEITKNGGDSYLLTGTLSEQAEGRARS